MNNYCSTPPAQPLIYQLRTLPGLNFVLVPSKSVDGSDLLPVVAILQLELVLYVYTACQKNILYFCAFYLRSQSPEEGAVNRICFIPASCERLSICNRIMQVPGHWCRFQIILASSCEQGLNIQMTKLYPMTLTLAVQRKAEFAPRPPPPPPPPLQDL